jgi:hypothetical protein
VFWPLAYTPMDQHIDCIRVKYRSNVTSAFEFAIHTERDKDEKNVAKTVL